MLWVSPAQVIFGNAIDLDRGIINPLMGSDDIPWDEYILEQNKLQQEILTSAAAAQFKSDQFNIAQRAPKHPYTEFPVNSYVLAKYERDEHLPPSKLHSYLRGPLRVRSTQGAI